MSHVARFQLSLDNERRLRAALEAIGCTITEGYFENPWSSMNRDRGVFNGDRCTSWDGKPVAFGFTVRRQQAGQPAGEAMTRFGFTRDTDGSLCLVGDTYGLGIGQDFVQRAIENSYVNEGVNEVVESLEELGFFEDTTESTVQLQMIA